MIGNEDVKNLKINELRSLIGVVLQDTTLFSGSIEDNLKFGKEDATEEMMISSVKDAQAFEFINANKWVCPPDTIKVINGGFKYLCSI